MSQEISIRRFWGSLLYIGLVTVLIFTVLSDWNYDDPYITYRYAYNLSHGMGFTYNPSERTLSTTTPLFTILLAILQTIWTNIPQLAKFISAVSLAVGALFLWDWALTWKNLAVGWTSLILYPTTSLLLLTLGSEIPLYLAFCLGAFTFYARKHDNLSALYSALATLTRPDGILVPIILLFDHQVRKREPFPGKALLLYIFLTLPWLIFAYAYFGSPIPVSLFAKQQQAFLAISSSFVQRFLSLSVSYTHHWRNWFEIALGVTGVVFAIWKSRQWIILFGWSFLYFATYAILGISGYIWYYAPISIMSIVAVGLGVQAILNSRGSINKWFANHWKLAGLGATTLTLAIFTPLIFGRMIDLKNIYGLIDPRYQIYRSVGDWLRENTPVNARVAVFETGIIGYYAHRPMMDFAGLLYPEIAAQLTADSSYEEAAHWALAHFQPQYVSFTPDIFPNLERSLVSEYCQLVRSFPGELYGCDSELNIYSCDFGEQNK